MGTRSVVALPEDGAFRGRYCHWDGYPTGVGAALIEIVKRDGLDTARRTLTADHYGWSSLDAEPTHELRAGLDDGRFADVPGYGIAYTTEQNQSSESDWITSNGGDWGTEWAYVLNERGLMVLERRWGDYAEDGEHMTGMFGMGADAGEGHWAVRGFVAYDAEDALSELTALQERATV